MDKHAVDHHCCLDCRWRELRGEPYGAVAYWCSVRERVIGSSRAGRQSCDRFVDWRSEPI